MKEAVKDFLSVDEKKFSALVLCLLFLVAIGGYHYIATGVLSVEIVELIKWFGMMVVGYNAVEKIGDFKKK